MLRAAALVVGLVGAVCAHAAVLYQAPADNTNQIGFAGNANVNGGGAFGVGNTITFGGAYPSYVLSTVDLFGYAGGGSKPIEVDIYSGADPNSGPLLGSAQVVPTGNGWTTEVLDFHNLVLPQTVTFIVSIVGNTGSWDDSFVNWQQFTGAAGALPAPPAGAPPPGTSGDMWYGASGAFVVDNSYATATGAQTNTLAVQFNAPEPSTWAMLALGFGGLALAAGRRARAARSIAL